jgi:glycerol uptake facilitator-like aquaporin
MVYGSTCFNQTIGFDLQFTFAIMMTFAVCNHPSNSNLNPMVTLAFCLRHTKRYQLQLLPMYLKAQFIGAFLGVITANILNGVYRSPMVPHEHTTEEYVRIALS